MASNAGIEAPTEQEKDPAFLALQVKVLKKALDNVLATNQHNLLEIQRALSMNDVNQQILTRVSNDLAASVSHIQGFLVMDGSGHLKLNGGHLDVPGYYAEFREVVQAAGPELGDIAAILWSKGASIPEAVEGAKLRKQAQEKTAAPEETDYEIELFGGTNGKGSDQQVAQGAQEAG